MAGHMKQSWQSLSPQSNKKRIRVYSLSIFCINHNKLIAGLGAPGRFSYPVDAIHWTRSFSQFQYQLKYFLFSFAISHSDQVFNSWNQVLNPILLERSELPMKCRIVDDLIDAWLNRLGFEGCWVFSFNADVSTGTWHKSGKRVLEWRIDNDELNRDVCICVSIGLGLEDEYTIDIDIEYIIVYSLLQIIYDIDDCCCELLHNKTASILGRQLTGWIVESFYCAGDSQKEPRSPNCGGLGWLENILTTI